MATRVLPVALCGALLALAAGASGCGGSSKAAGTVNGTITVGTSTVGTAVSGGAGSGQGGGASSAAGGASSGGASSGGASSGGASSGGGSAASFGDAGAGKPLFSAKCSACHALKDAGAAGNIGPNLDASAVAKDAQQVYDQIVEKAVPPMPKGLYTGQDAKNVAAYVASVSGK
jgi:mono/diheme cytochrome c family protein